VTLSRTSMLSMPSAWQPPEDYCRMIKGVHIDVSYRADVGGILLDERTPFTIRIPYEDGTHAKIELADIEYGSLDERTLRPFYYDLAQEKWLPLDSVEVSLDVERNLIEIVAPSGLLSTFRTAESPTTYTLYISLSARGCDCQGGGVQTLYWNLSTDPLSLDPSLATDTASQQVIKQLFGSLGQYDDKTMEVLPDLAKSWDLDAAANTWTFHLRDDVQWTDGSKVTASDVEYGIKRLIAYETASEYAYVLYLIKGAEAYNTGTGSAADVGVRAVDPVTVAITLSYPAACFPSIAALCCVPLPQRVIEKYGDQWTEAKNIVTNGPYTLGEWVYGDHLTLVKNPDYYESGNVKIDRVYCYVVSEQSMAMAMYEAGKLDVNDNLPLVDLPRIKADPALSKELNRAPLLYTYRYGFNTATPPIDNINVRKALASCVDRQGLIDNVLKGNQWPAQTWTPPGIFGYVDGLALGIGYTYDPEKARQYLADAGYPGGVGFPEITLMFITRPAQQEIAEFIAQGWEDVLRIRVNLESQWPGEYFGTLATDAPQVFYMAWSADYPDANNWLHEVFHSGSGSNVEKYSNPQFDALVEQAAVELDSARRLQLCKQAEILLCQTDVAFIPIYFGARNVLTRPYVVRTFAAIGGEAWKNWCILPH